MDAFFYALITLIFVVFQNADAMGAAEKISNKTYSIEEYLELEAQAEHKSEFWNGQIVAMAGASPNHNKIANSVGTAIDNALDEQRKNCMVYSSDQKVFIPKTNGFVYPDCTIVCGEEKFHEESKVVLTNPCLLIEVLSESTKGDDRAAKFEGYRSIPSFKEYVLVWQTIPKIQSWYKEAEDLWRISSVFGLDQTIYLHTLDCEIALADVYRRINELGEVDTAEAY